MQKSRSVLSLFQQIPPITTEPDSLLKQSNNTYQNYMIPKPNIKIYQEKTQKYILLQRWRSAPSDLALKFIDIMLVTVPTGTRQGLPRFSRQDGLVMFLLPTESMGFGADFTRIAGPWAPNLGCQ